ncbi:MAG: hypothetical protein AAFX81_20315 [Pseudomonadota bacterium]
MADIDPEFRTASDIDPEPRRIKALERRQAAAAASTNQPFPAQIDNGDEAEPFMFNFTKGLRHGADGLIMDFSTYHTFRDATLSADPAVFAGVMLNPFQIGDLGPREYESPTGGHAYVLEGPDPFALTMPPAPRAGSTELAAELAEVYQMALHRELPVAAFMDAGLVQAMGPALADDERQVLDDAASDVAAAATRLGTFRWFQGNVVADKDETDPNKRERRRFGVAPTPANLYRGVAFGDDQGPFLSQFMVIGTDNGDRASAAIRYGNQRIEQKVRVAHPGVDYMTAWQSWLDVQNAANVRPGTDEFVKVEGAIQYRIMTRLRDLATYVHDDALYQAYLTACLFLLGEERSPGNRRFAFDAGLPFHGATTNPAGAGGPNREPFAVFGPPHLLTLVCEVASRALRAVRAQKFSVHRRLRPEALGALMHTVYSGYQPDGPGSTLDDDARRLLGNTIAPYAFPTDAPGEPAFDDLLTEVRRHNARQNDVDEGPGPHSSWLLPMAFPEGSPMHPAYGAGHATVAGACVTVLKAFFELGQGHDRVKLVGT